MAPLILRLLAGAGTAALFGLAAAQFPPTPEGVTVIKSKYNENITISYKEPKICETTPGVKSYSGFIHLPPGTLDVSGGQTQNFPINTFFWFFEARKDPQNAPLTVWMNGGPGASSMPGLFNENGPCFVNNDSSTTRLNPTSWNQKSNMVYIDQPVQVGFSYNTLVNVTVDVFGGTRPILPGQPIPAPNSTLHVGTYPSANVNNTSLGSINGAMALWHFFQVFLTEFPGYQPKDDRFSIATQSYGGRYGPAMAGFFELQNERIRNGTLSGSSAPNKIINLDTLLLVNSCIDRQVQWPFYREMAFNNTYGIKTLPDSEYGGMLDAYERLGGCRDQVENCRSLSSLHDPLAIGKNATVNKVCQEAETFCSRHLREPYTRRSGRDYYDVTQINPTMFPEPFVPAFLNQRHVQLALGVPLNFSGSSDAVSAAYRSIGDYNRPGWLDAMGKLLDAGKKVTLMYGDRDFACNWMGGEAASLAIPWRHRAEFAAAGYSPLVGTGDMSESGLVRQYSNLSFTRVFQAGHAAPAYQQNAGLAIFSRAVVDNRDVATGTVDTATKPDYRTTGPSSVRDVKSRVPDQIPYFCYTLKPDTCTDEQIAALKNGSAIIKDYIMIDPPYRQGASRVVARSIREHPDYDHDLRM
ncbi:carboxypeptidase S1 [Magnaporthiopsis poae ATCC 64411]|uniref:Carboxypeptidase S1 n=1 Tax=Magnaporthiopsis poae (strain ATCC 64411 / 73-15) TaxID=644358 RepID=A0A0C4EBU2_MAGP6|nr:carboxypeptidase S1 [Magnaporthiopsis poae ATCC 64411]